MDRPGASLNDRRVPLVALALAALAALLYIPRLETAPIYLFPDEVIVGLQAHSLATTGRDAFHARRLPLFFEYNRLMVDNKGVRGIRNSWLPPAIFYAAALSVKLFSLSEIAIRLPTALVGIANVVLLYFVGLRMFRNQVLAALSAVLLALTPSHMIHSRMAADYLYPVPFMLVWLLCLLTYLETRRERTLAIGMASLGLGLYSYAAAPFVMPFYVVMTLIVLAMERRPWRTHLMALAVFGVFVLPACAWVIRYPDMVTDVIVKYALYSSSGVATPLQAVRGLLTYHRIADQLGLYWGFFNPRFLFFDGPMEMMFSTRQVGVFLLPVAALLIVGLYATIRSKVTASAILLLLGFFTAPIAATLVNINDAIYRALWMLPFGVLLATCGVIHLWSSPLPTPKRRVFIGIGAVLLLFAFVYAARVLMAESRIPGAAAPLAAAGALTIALGLLADRLRLGQMVAAGLIAAVPLQFLPFYVDYFTDYRRRTAFIFSGNLRGAFEEVLRHDRDRPVPSVYLGEIATHSSAPLYWKFYLIKYKREELAPRTIEAYLFYPDQVAKLPAGSVVVTNAGDAATDAIIDRFVASGQFTRTVIKEPDGTPSYVVLQRTAGA